MVSDDADDIIAFLRGETAKVILKAALIRLLQDAELGWYLIKHVSLLIYKPKESVTYGQLTL